MPWYCREPFRQDSPNVAHRAILAVILLILERYKPAMQDISSILAKDPLFPSGRFVAQFTTLLHSHDTSLCPYPVSFKRKRGATQGALP